MLFQLQLTSLSVRLLFSVFNNFPQFSWNQLCIAEESHSLSVVPFRVDLPLYHMQNFRSCPLFL